MGIILMTTILLSSVTGKSREPSYGLSMRRDRNPKIIIIVDSSNYRKYDYKMRNIARTLNAIEEDKKERKKAALVRKQHKQRMKEINEFMKDHMMTTLYFYKEMKRIKEQRSVKGPLRNMIEWLELPGREKEKKEVLDCYIEMRKRKAKEPGDIWKQYDTNNLVINTIRDPFNEGHKN
ncbi:uncharacterized protein LOC135084652 [Ostrinia nubilalis]|uniref:uncharacterized protein LOC135084652 n=1 Tax=Ostrinia nubilalis TaxID=29057 RepID=UPI003082643B